MTSESHFAADSHSASALTRWFEGLDIGQRARLRHCHNPMDVVLEPVFHQLAGRLKEIDSRRLAPIAWTLSHIRGHDQRSLGKAFKEKVSEPRFRRLLEAADRDELANDLRSTVRLLGNRANIVEVARVIYWWGDSERRRLATEYYGGTE
jgi:CRISPR type I-E-associated protein CasB/Cse2